VDHEINYKCKVYENGRVAADPETLRQLARFSEREIANGTGLHRKPIRLFRHGRTVTRRTYEKIITFLQQHISGCEVTVQPRPATANGFVAGRAILKKKANAL
jgi:hypothetical protein